MTETIEYRVRPVTRWIVTRYTETKNGGSIETIGEFENELNAHFVCAACLGAEAEDRDVMGEIEDVTHLYDKGHISSAHPD